MSGIYLEVAVDAPFDHSLTYSLPAGMELPMVGRRLLVPLGRRFVTGYLMGHAARPDADIKIKPVKEILDNEPLFPESIIPFYRWVSTYYQHPLGPTIKAALPGGLSPRSGFQLVLTDRGREHLKRSATESQEDLFWLDPLLEKGRLSSTVSRRVARKKGSSFLSKWEADGWIEIDRTVEGARLREKYETYVRLPDDVPRKQDDTSLKPAEKKTLALLDQLFGTDSGSKSLPRRKVTEQYKGAAKALKSLADKGMVIVQEQQVYRDPFGGYVPCFEIPLQLTDEQQEVLKKIIAAIQLKHFSPFLLHGVTGSGKTEVYLRAAAETIKQGRGVVVLVPEIALATQLEGHFLARFGKLVALLHSGLSRGERLDQWLRLVRGEASIVIGARSAIFAPLADVGLIIVDEEHDSSYKQEDGLRYHGRDLAVLRASQGNAVVLLGTATPSITSYHHAMHGKYELLCMEKRIEDRPLPDVEIVDLSMVKTVSGRAPYFSNKLVKALKTGLANGEQSILFLNRRGYARYVICKDCGHVIQCPHCNVSLTYHKQKNRLICHHCDFLVTSAQLCPNCQSTRFIPMGFGTEKLEQELIKLFPGARINRLDRDTGSKRNDFLAILKAMHEGDIDILVGTQMIAKGHHFPNVTLVGVVWGDVGLGVPDFRAGEKTFQLISQVSGRAGRGEKPGRVLIQTHQADHYCISLAREHNYKELYEREIALRKGLDFPPFSRLINIKIEGPEEKKVTSTATLLADRARKIAGGRPVTVMGPVPAPLERLRDNYRWQLILKGQSVDDLHYISRVLAEKKTERNVKVMVDVDPENLM